MKNNLLLLSRKILYTFLLLLTAMAVRAQGSWTLLPRLPRPTAFMAAQAMDGRLYVAGGVRDEKSASVEFFAYDPLDSSWTGLPPLPEPRCGATMVELGSRLYVLGGATDLWGTVTNTLFAYDAETGAWATLAAMPTARAYLGACALDGRIFAIGGISDFLNTALDRVEVYDPVTDTWSSAASLPEARGGANCVALGGKIYCLGGSADVDLPASAALFVYNPETGNWASGSDLPTPRVFAAACGSGEKIYVAGGSCVSGEEAELGAFEAFDVVRQAWQILPPLPTVRQGLALVPLHGRVFALGGLEQFGGTRLVLDRLEVYDPPLLPTREPSWRDAPAILSVTQQPGNSEIFLTIHTCPGGRVRAEVWNTDGELMQAAVLGDWPAGTFVLPLRLAKQKRGTYLIRTTLNEWPFGSTKVVMR